MAKNKKKSKGKSWNKRANRWINQNQATLAFIGGMAGGAALTAAIISGRGQELFSGISGTVKDWMPAKAEEKSDSKGKSKDKKNVPAAAAS